MRHNIYLDDTTEDLIDLLGLAKDGWSQLFKTALTSHLATLPPAKVERAARRIARTRSQTFLQAYLQPAGD